MYRNLDSLHGRYKLCVESYMSDRRNAAGGTLWTSIGGASSFAHLDPPANLAELAIEVAKTSHAASEARVRPYRTPVTPDTLRAPAE
jgi:hypothetical protein